MNVHLSLNNNTVSRTERKYHEMWQASPHSSKMTEPQGLMDWQSEAKRLRFEGFTGDR